jgi:corrinoid protein of di/trimethylamine methyltransferase
MAVFTEISEALQNGKAKAVRELVQRALEEGNAPGDILNEGLLAAMDIVGERFKNNEVFVPEVMISARAMNGGMEVLKPHLAESGVTSIGKVAIGTVRGDLHDIGKNLVRMMFVGKGIVVLDLGVDVPPERFYEAYEKEGVQIIACSALLTTTMNEMKGVVDLFAEKGARDKVTIMVGGAPITESFCKAIGADWYTPDAASAANVAKDVLLKGRA